ncbi:hypothetical protein [Micromonospora zhanjiangensis]|uniref:Uncharacterized protein n=1 Tax=Micromonospora zhanjiangensis TaxID=1522057 RepID=A0ABV8KX18_9ACTN
MRLSSRSVEPPVEHAGPELPLVITVCDGGRINGFNPVQDVGNFSVCLLLRLGALIPAVDTDLEWSGSSDVGCVMAVGWGRSMG